MKSDRYSIRGLLQLTAGKFSVSRYKRPYVWGQYRPGECDTAMAVTHYLLDHTVGGKTLQALTLARRADRFEVIDGQQRLIYIYLLLRRLGYDGNFDICLEGRPLSTAFLRKYEAFPESGFTLDENERIQDIFFFKKTLLTIDSCMEGHSRQAILDYVLSDVCFVAVISDGDEMPLRTYMRMNSAASPMYPSDIIKADIMRLASSNTVEESSRSNVALRRRYATFWDGMVHWWSRAEVKEYFGITDPDAPQLPLRLCIRDSRELRPEAPLTYYEFLSAMSAAGVPVFQAVKHFHIRLRGVQKRFEDAFADTTTYNRIRAILLLQDVSGRFAFLHMYFVQCALDAAQLERYYKLSFLGMSIDDIAAGHSPRNRFQEVYDSLSQADVYHTEAKKHVLNLLLRLNIDEDIKLGRRFDFSIWNNRSLEHIFSKSKVWHIGQDGRPADGNDNHIAMPRVRLEHDRSFMPRSIIRTSYGRQLSEHCIGNLVLMYGENNSAFGNSNFERKKSMFLTPGDMTVFHSRNLLHTVCVFAGAEWNHTSIVNNYKLTLKNFRLYYGY